MSEAELTPQEIIEKIPGAFQADKAEGLDATFQFDISGDQGGLWYAQIKDAACQVFSGRDTSPNITISIGDQNFVKLMNGRLDGTMAFMTGKLKVKGDMGLAMRLSRIFKLPGSA